MAVKPTSDQDLKKIIKRVDMYKQTTDKEIRLLKLRIAKLQKAVEKNMILEDEPDAYEIKAVKDFESKRKKNGMRFVPLDALDNKM